MVSYLQSFPKWKFSAFSSKDWKTQAEFLELLVPINWVQWINGPIQCKKILISRRFKKREQFTFSKWDNICIIIFHYNSNEGWGNVISI